MKGEKRGDTLWKPRAVKKEIEIVSSTRVLRSYKRKLAEQEEKYDVNLVEKKRRKSVIGDASDCVILSDTDAGAPSEKVNTLITSTPIRINDQKTPNFEESCIKPPQSTQSDNDPVEVIVISDSSAATLPVITLSDGDESVVEVITSTKKCKTALHNPFNGETEAKKTNKILTEVVNNENPKVSTERNANKKPVNIPRNRRNFNSKRYRSDRRHRTHDRYRPGRHKPKTMAPCHFGENIYVENPVVLPKTGLRPIIIDGSNVAFHHSNNSYFSCKGLEICIKYFKNRGHEVIAFVPHYRVKYNETDNPKLLDLLVKSGDVVLTPSRMVNGSLVVSYDDRFIVQTAVIKGGVIVTRDNYRDLLDENPAWAETIKYRLLQFTWIQDLLMFPNDPLGKRGPSLEEFLRFG